MRHVKKLQSVVPGMWKLTKHAIPRFADPEYALQQITGSRKTKHNPQCIAFWELLHWRSDV